MKKITNDEFIELTKIKNIKFKLIITACILVYAAVLFALKLSCPILALTGVPCLGCGMSRAIQSALKLDFAAAFSYHRMFWSLPLLYICFLLDGKLFKRKVLNIIFYALISILFVLNWLFNII